MDFSSLRPEPNKRVVSKAEMLQRLIHNAALCKQGKEAKALICTVLPETEYRLWLVQVIDNREYELSEQMKSLAKAITEFKEVEVEQPA